MHRLAVNLELVLLYRGDEAFVQAVLAQVTWHHNLAILERFAAADDRICCPAICSRIGLTPPPPCPLPPTGWRPPPCCRAFPWSLQAPIHPPAHGATW
jgi:hypothetical protein